MMETTIEKYHREGREKKRMELEDALNEAKVCGDVNLVLEGMGLPFMFRREAVKKISALYKVRFNKYHNSI